MRKIIREVADILFPRRCPFCDAVITAKEGICAACRMKITYTDEPVCKRCGQPVADERQEYCYDCNRKTHVYHAGKAVFTYQGVVKQSLYRFKYANKREYAICYGQEAVRLWGSWILARQIEAVIPIPLHRKRQRMRGYNQAELFAREVGRNLHLPVRTDIVYRSVNTTPQKNLDDQQRKKNLKKAFTISQNIVQLKKVLLVDDIYTTGSTVDAVAQCLKEAGVEEVYVLCISIGRGY